MWKRMGEKSVIGDTLLLRWMLAPHQSRHQSSCHLLYMKPHFQLGANGNKMF